MRLTFLGAALGTVAILTPAAAQTCSTLGATWTQSTTTLAITLAGAPANAPTMTLVGLHQGTTTMMHGLTLGLAMPFYTMFFGVTDATGNLAASRTLANAPTGVTAYLQSVSMDMTGHTHGGGMGQHGSMTFCVSNVAQVVFL